MGGGFKKEIKPALEPQIIEKVVEISVNNDIIKQLNEMNIEYWELTSWSNDSYTIRVTLEDKVSITRDAKNLEELNSAINFIEEILNRLKE